MGRDLVVNPCQSNCNWHPTDDEIDGLQVYACGACHSEWTAAQPWTPMNVDGEITAEVRSARAAHQ